MMHKSEALPSENSQEPIQDIMEDEVEQANQPNTDPNDDWA